MAHFGHRAPSPHRWLACARHALMPSCAIARRIGSTLHRECGAQRRRYSAVKGAEAASAVKGAEAAIGSQRCGGSNRQSKVPRRQSAVKGAEASIGSQRCGGGNRQSKVRRRQSAVKGAEAAIGSQRCGGGIGSQRCGGSIGSRCVEAASAVKGAEAASAVAAWRRHCSIATYRAMMRSSIAHGTASGQKQRSDICIGLRIVLPERPAVCKTTPAARKSLKPYC